MTLPSFQFAKYLGAAAISMVVGPWALAADAPLTPEEIAVADQVQTGHFPCELGASVTIEADAKSPGYFDLRLGSRSYRMAPHITTTGAVRLEDRKVGAVWLQIGNKSMLLNERTGTRVADDCQSPAQAAVSAELRAHPEQQSIDAR